jgi:hypothetical protein
MIAELLSSLANNVVARQYDLPEWSTFLKTAFKSFGTKAFATELSDAENDQVKKRDFVPLMDQVSRDWENIIAPRLYEHKPWRREPRQMLTVDV